MPYHVQHQSRRLDWLLVAPLVVVVAGLIVLGALGLHLDPVLLTCLAAGASAALGCSRGRVEPKEKPEVLPLPGVPQGCTHPARDVTLVRSGVDEKTLLARWCAGCQTTLYDKYWMKSGMLRWGSDG